MFATRFCAVSPGQLTDVTIGALAAASGVTDGTKYELAISAVAETTTLKIEIETDPEVEIFVAADQTVEVYKGLTPP